MTFFGVALAISAAHLFGVSFYTMTLVALVFVMAEVWSGIF